jgi:hypothetical protein
MTATVAVLKVMFDEQANPSAPRELLARERFDRRADVMDRLDADGRGHRAALRCRGDGRSGMIRP